MSRKLTSLIAAAAIFGVAGVANVHAQAAKNPKDQVEENRNTNPAGKQNGQSDTQTHGKNTGMKNNTGTNTSGTMNTQTNNKNMPKVTPKNPPQADENRNTNPSGK